jgi:hypothetical protein
MIGSLAVISARLAPWVKLGRMLSTRGASVFAIVRGADVDEPPSFSMSSLGGLKTEMIGIAAFVV